MQGITDGKFVCPDIHTGVQGASAWEGYDIFPFSAHLQGVYKIKSDDLKDAITWLVGRYACFASSTIVNKDNISL